MKAITASLLLFKYAFAQMAEPPEVITCTSEPCIIKPNNDPTRTSYVVITNQFNDCLIDCTEENCAKTNGPMLIYSGCNNTVLNCGGSCESLYMKAGELGDMIIDQNNHWTYRDFSGSKNSATVNCLADSCLKMELYFSGTFDEAVNVNGVEIEGLIETKIDCENVNGKCNVNCEDIDGDLTCMKNTLICGTQDDNDCGCVGVCDLNGIQKEVATVERLDTKVVSVCGEVKPSGEKIIATNDCDQLTVDCTEGNCGASFYDKKFMVISGAKRTTILCGGKLKNCEFMTVRGGQIEDKYIPMGYIASDFSGEYINFRIECNSIQACPFGNIRIIGHFEENVQLNAIGQDAFQNGKLYCDVRGNIGNCLMKCHFEGCDGSMFDCNIGINDEKCLCDNMNDGDIIRKNEPPRRLQTIGLSTIAPISSTIIPIIPGADGPTCPPINFGRPYEPGMPMVTTTTSTTSTTSTNIEKTTTTPVKTTAAPVETTTTTIAKTTTTPVKTTTATTTTQPPATTSTTTTATKTTSTTPAKTTTTIKQTTTTAQQTTALPTTIAQSRRGQVNQVQAQKEVTVTNATRKGGKLAAIIVLFVLAGIIGVLYFVIYKTRYCSKLKQYESQLSGYGSFTEYEMTAASFA